MMNAFQNYVSFITLPNLVYNEVEYRGNGLYWPIRRYDLDNRKQNAKEADPNPEDK